MRHVYMHSFAKAHYLSVMSFLLQMFMWFCFIYLINKSRLYLLKWFWNHVNVFVFEKNGILL